MPAFVKGDKGKGDDGRDRQDWRGSNTTASLYGDVGVVLISDQVLTSQRVLEEVDRQRVNLGFSKVLSKGTAVVEMLPFQYRAALLSSNPTWLFSSAFGVPVRIFSVYLDVKGNYSCVFSSQLSIYVAASVATSGIPLHRECSILTATQTK